MTVISALRDTEVKTGSRKDMAICLQNKEISDNVKIWPERCSGIFLYLGVNHEVVLEAIPYVVMHAFPPLRALLRLRAWSTKRTRPASRQAFPPPLSGFRQD